MRRITLLTQVECAYCDHAKAVLERVGADHPLDVTEISLASDEGQAAAARMGMLFAPGLLIDDEPFGYGRISERRLRRTLSRQPKGI